MFIYVIIIMFTVKYKSNTSVYIYLHLINFLISTNKFTGLGAITYVITHARMYMYIEGGNYKNKTLRNQPEKGDLYKKILQKLVLLCLLLSAFDF